MTIIACFALVVSLAINYFSMDRILGSKFSLQPCAEQSERTALNGLGTLNLDLTQQVLENWILISINTVLEHWILISLSTFLDHGTLISLSTKTWSRGPFANVPFRLDKENV